MQVGYVLPSIGRNLRLLEIAIKSVLEQPCESSLVIVSPENATSVHNLAREYNLPVIWDRSIGVPAAFNLGVEYLESKGVDYFGVLGEDDQLLPNSTINLLKAFKDETVQAAVGQIWYINDKGEIVFHNRAFPSLLPILHLIPNVIPHPGSLCRISVWKLVGGFDQKYKFASDLDFWLKIRKHGKIARVECPMSFFGFTEQGNTAKYRKESILEGREVRLKHSPTLLRPIQVFLDHALTFAGEKIIQRNNKI
jgi:hypothetical protein